MKTLFFAAIRCSLMFAAVTAPLFSVRPAQAYTVRLQQMGSNVVANGSGAINLTGLTFLYSRRNPGILNAPVGVIVMGPPEEALVDFYGSSFDFSGPPNFGSGGYDDYFFPNTGSGGRVGVDSFDRLILVPQGYLTNTALSSSMTFDNQTISSMGLRPGTYVWSWGTGLPNQNFTLRVVPDTGSTVSLLGCALLGLAALRRKLTC